MDRLVIGGVVILVGLLLLYAVAKSSSTAPVETPTGGTTLAGSPSVNPPATGTIAAVSGATPSAPKATSKIMIIKNTSGGSASPTDSNWRTFQVAEVFAYSGSSKLSASDYSSATLSSVYQNKFPASFAIDGNPGTFSHTAEDDQIGTLTLTLKNPTVITRVEVLNRQDCCQGRLDGAQLVLKDSSDVTIWSGTLTGARDIQAYTM